MAFLARWFFVTVVVFPVMVPECGAQQVRTADNLPPSNTVLDPIRRGADGKLQRMAPPAAGEGPGPADSGPCSKGTFCVGPGLQYSTLGKALAAAGDGSIIEVMPGTYRETARINRSNLLVRGVKGRVHFDCAGLRPADDKACLLLAGNNVTLEGLEISGAEISGGLGANAACIRNEPDRNYTLRRIICHDSQNGILSSGGTILIENSEFYGNSWTGLTHNVYFTGNCIEVTVRGSTFRDARVAHEFKSRCRKTTITDSTFRNTKGSRALDIPDGGETLISGGLIEQKRGVQNPEIIGFAAERCNFPAPMRVIRTRIIVEHPNAAIHNFNKCEGQPIVLEGVIFEGRRPRLEGYVIER